MSCRAAGVTSHDAQNTGNFRSVVGGRTTRHISYGLSAKHRNCIGTHLGRLKSVVGTCQVKEGGLETDVALFELAMAAGNPVLLPKLIVVEAAT